jgi:pimeloyl-ACP methyl ester carboxylesterase
MGRGNKRYVERGSVEGVEWMRSRSRLPKGLVIAPPLIGGHALQQLRMLRPLVRRRLDLLSFSYAGHGASEGDFSLRATIDNSLAALDLATTVGRFHRIPLFGAASCFAAVPMLHAIHQRGEPLEKLVLINALPHLRYEKMAYEFYRYWRRHRRWGFTKSGLKAALRAYRDELLPRVNHGHKAFGILSRQRIHWPSVFRDMVAYRKLSAHPLRATQVLCIYGRHDRLLPHAGFSDWSGYEAHIRRICPGAVFRRMTGDHFFTGPKIRRKVIEAVSQFFCRDYGR